jgi:polar amino acid transport system substrate-binding protein
MRRIKCVLALAFCCLALAPAGADEHVRLASGEWPPYAGAALPYGEVAEHIISAAFGEVGIKVSFERLSWKRGYEVARQGKLDGAILWSAPSKNDPDFIGTDTVMTGSVVLFHRNETPLENTDPDSMRGYRLALPDGYGYEQIPAYAALIKASGKPPVLVADDRQGMSALLNNRIDVYPVDRLVGLYLLAHAGHPDWRSQLTFLPKAVSLEPLSILLCRHHTSATVWQRKFNRGMAILRTKGLAARWLAEVEPAAASQPDTPR